MLRAEFQLNSYAMDTTSPLPQTLDQRGWKMRRTRALLGSRTTIRLREVPEGFNGRRSLTSGHFRATVRRLGGPVRCGLAPTLRMSCFEIPTLERNYMTRALREP